MRLRPLAVMAIASVAFNGCAPNSTTPVINFAAEQRAMTLMPKHTAPPIYVFPQITPSPKCLPPCFYDVMPGKTTITEALTLLHGSLDQVIDHKLNWAPASARLRLPSNFVVFEQDIVNLVFLNESGMITFQDVVTQYGNPDSIVIGWPGGEMAVDDTILVYSTKGMAFLSSENRPNSPAERYILKPEMPVYGLIYFPPSTDKAQFTENTMAAITSGLKIRNWSGFWKSVYEP